MRVFYDTEFVENGRTIDLVSIGLVAEDGREYYAVNRDVRMAVGAGAPIQIGVAEFDVDPAGDVILSESEIADVLRRVADSIALGPTPEPEPEPRDAEEARPRLFRLMRDIDVTGVSGDGHVADGVLWSDGTVVIRWLGAYASTVVWDDLDKAMHVHGHRGATRVEWLDEDTKVSDPKEATP